MIRRMRPVDTSQVYPALRRVQTPVMMRIDAAGFTEMMLCGVRAETAGRQVVCAFCHLNRGRRGRDRSGLPARAERTITTRCI